jgi:hypothetical protein
MPRQRRTHIELQCNQCQRLSHIASDEGSSVSFYLGCLRATLRCSVAHVCCKCKPVPDRGQASKGDGKQLPRLLAESHPCLPCEWAPLNCQHHSKHHIKTRPTCFSAPWQIPSIEGPPSTKQASKSFPDTRRRIHCVPPLSTLLAAKPGR